MKQKDVAVIIIVVFVSGVLSFFISNTLFAAPKDLRTEVEVVEPISAEFVEPDDSYFNTNSVNPTQPITIGEDQNQQPFQSTQN